MGGVNLRDNCFQNYSFPDRSQVEAVIETLIGLLDAMDGDPDLEPNGDEADGQITDDEAIFDGPACAYGRDDLPGDPLDAEDDNPCEIDEAEGGRCAHYGIDQRQILPGRYGGPTGAAAIPGRDVDDLIFLPVPAGLEWSGPPL